MATIKVFGECLVQTTDQLETLPQSIQAVRTKTSYLNKQTLVSWKEMCICVPKEQLNSGTHPSMQNYNKQHSFQICDHLDSFGGLFSRRHMCIINHYQNKSHISHIKEQSVLTENSQIYSQKDINLCSEFPANHRTMVTNSYAIQFNPS